MANTVLAIKIRTNHELYLGYISLFYAELGIIVCNVKDQQFDLSSKDYSLGNCKDSGLKHASPNLKPFLFRETLYDKKHTIKHKLSTNEGVWVGLGKGWGKECFSNALLVHQKSSYESVVNDVIV